MLQAMKKMLLAVSVFCIQFTHAQTVVDFEDLTLPGVDTAWFGEDQSGGFTSGTVFFKNTYTISQWGNYWSHDFIYTNATDSTTAGYTNDYSAITAKGANNSPNYAMCFGSGEIDFGSPKIVNSIAITNSTYAALSMRDGDAFAKQFGDSTNAQGNIDGTNGEDWFVLTIKGKDSAGVVTDSVLVYLADFRFSNPAQDYILKTWENVDLTSLGDIRYVSFSLSSSDIGSFGMNTPAYFALDNLTFSPPSYAGISEELTQQVAIYPNPTVGIFTVKSSAGSLKVYDLSGSLVSETKTTGVQHINLQNLDSGVYLVELTTSTGSTRTRVIKN